MRKLLVLALFGVVVVIAACAPASGPNQQQIPILQRPVPTSAVALPTWTLPPPLPTSVQAEFNVNIEQMGQDQQGWQKMDLQVQPFWQASDGSKTSIIDSNLVLEFPNHQKRSLKIESKGKGVQLETTKFVIISGGGWRINADVGFPISAFTLYLKYQLDDYYWIVNRY